jgi:hypothetical protein
MPQKYDKAKEYGRMDTGKTSDTNTRMNGAGQPPRTFKIVDGNERSVIKMPFTSIEHQNPGMRKVGGLHPADEYGTPTYNTNGKNIFGV